MSRVRLLLSGLASALILVGCVPAPGRIDGGLTLSDPVARAAVSNCCRSSERFPDWMVGIAEANIDLTRRIGLVQLRQGHLGTLAQARAVVEGVLQPFDILLVHSEGRMSGHLIPGQFTHGAIYLGTEAQLRAAGLWALPEMAPYHAQIRAGHVFLEAVYGGVRLAPANVVLNTDATVILRAHLTAAQSRDTLRRGLERMGIPFDMRFDVATSDALFCAELIDAMYPGLNLPISTVYETRTIIPDVIVAGALLGEVPLGLVAYVEATGQGGARALSANGLAARIADAWPAGGTAPAPYPAAIAAVR